VDVDELSGWTNEGLQTSLPVVARVGGGKNGDAVGAAKRLFSMRRNVPFGVLPMMNGVSGLLLSTAPRLNGEPGCSCTLAVVVSTEYACVLLPSCGIV
jgi:hypothetical protein